MELKDLMINDWVSVSGTPMQVACIGTTKVGFYDEKGGFFFHDCENVKPIELTAEILKKNGFRPLYDDLSAYKLFWSDEKEENYWSITIDLTHPIASRIENNIMRTGKYWERWEMKGSVYFVHELQHLMRQFRIDKEIEL